MAETTPIHIIKIDPDTIMALVRGDDVLAVHQNRVIGFIVPLEKDLKFSRPMTLAKVTEVWQQYLLEADVKEQVLPDDSDSDSDEDEDEDETGDEDIYRELDAEAAAELALRQDMERDARIAQMRTFDESIG